MPGDTELVSVIIPCFNGAKYLRETLESATGQSYRPLEIIVIDDGSTDDSAEIAESFGSPVRVIRQANQGESVARNNGINMAKGSCVFFLDADDLLHPCAIEELRRAVGESRSVVAQMGCAWFHEDPTHPYESQRPTSGDRFFPEIIRSNLGPIHTWLAPRDLVQRVGGFRCDLQMYEDWEFWCRVALAGTKRVPIDLVGAFYRRHPQSQLASSKRSRIAAGHVSVMQTVSQGILQSKELCEEHAEALFWAGWTALHNGRKYKMSKHELQPLATNIEQLVRKQPIALRKLRFASLVRVLGIRWADTLRNLVVRNDTSPTPLVHQASTP